MPITAAQMESDLKLLNEAVDKVGAVLPTDTRAAFFERSGRYLEKLATRVDMQREFEAKSPQAALAPVVEQAARVARVEQREAISARAVGGTRRGGRASRRGASKSDDGRRTRHRHVSRRRPGSGENCGGGTSPRARGLGGATSAGRQCHGASRGFASCRCAARGVAPRTNGKASANFS